jgi:hypothetical protein
MEMFVGAIELFAFEAGVVEQNGAVIPKGTIPAFFRV